MLIKRYVRKAGNQLKIHLKNTKMRLREMKKKAKNACCRDCDFGLPREDLINKQS